MSGTPIRRGRPYAHGASISVRSGRSPAPIDAGETDGATSARRFPCVACETGIRIRVLPRCAGMGRVARSDGPV
ncbi:hypothetical protein GCM10023223_48580 [Stackebrandtia albiflava]